MSDPEQISPQYPGSCFLRFGHHFGVLGEGSGARAVPGQSVECTFWSMSKTASNSIPSFDDFGAQNDPQNEHKTDQETLPKPIEKTRNEKVENGTPPDPASIDFVLVFTMESLHSQVPKGNRKCSRKAPKMHLEIYQKSSKTNRKNWRKTASQITSFWE